MSSTRGSQVVDVGGRHPGDVGGDGRHLGQLGIPGAVDRFAGQSERGHRSRHEVVCGIGIAAAVGRDPAGIGDQLGIEQRSPAQVFVDPSAQVGVEEPAVPGGQHRGEHPERVARQLGGIHRPERGGHHRHGRSGLAQVVVADRVHSERREKVCDIGQFARCPDADRPVAFGGDPLDRSEPLGVRVGGHIVAVDGLADLDERGVGRNLGAVHRRQRRGEARPQLPDRDVRRVHRDTGPAIVCGDGGQRRADARSRRDRSHAGA